MSAEPTFQNLNFHAGTVNAVLDFYGISETSAKFCQPENWPKSAGSATPKPCKPFRSYDASKPIWLQINDVGANFNKVKASIIDVVNMKNLAFEAEYPPEPEKAHRVGVALAQKLVELGYAEPGLPVEDSGAGFHIVIPIVPIETAKHGGPKLVNEAVQSFVETYIKPEFDRLVEAESLQGEIKLEAFNIDRVLSIPGTWRPGEASQMTLTISKMAICVVGYHRLIRKHPYALKVNFSRNRSQLSALIQKQK